MIAKKEIDANKRVQEDGGEIPFIYIAAVKHKNIEVVRKLLEEGADPNDALKGTSLEYLIGDKDKIMPIIELLLQEGADPHAKDFLGKSAYNAIVMPGFNRQRYGPREQTLIKLFASKYP